MKKGVLGVIITVIALVAIVIVVALNGSDQTNSSVTTQENVDHNQISHSEETDTNTETSANATAEVKSGEVSVDISGYEFSEKALRIKKGTTVTWTNRDTVRHDVKPDAESDAFKASKLLAKNESYSHTFDVPGNYSYFCSPHPYMKASIEVVE